MTTDAVVGGISGVATYYSTGGVYSTTSIDRRYGGSTTPTSTKPTQGDKPNGSTSGDNPLDDAVRNASGEYAGEQANGAAQSENVGSKPCTGANPNGVKVSVGQQDKHIPGTNNFQQGVDNGLSRSIALHKPSAFNYSMILLGRVHLLETIKNGSILVKQLVSISTLT